jgi:hypothetical protein
MAGRDESLAVVPVLLGGGLRLLPDGVSGAWARDENPRLPQPAQLAGSP